MPNRTTGFSPSGAVVPWYLAYLVMVPFYFRKPWRHPMEVRAYGVQREVM